MADKLSLYNNALFAIQQRKVSSLTEAVPSRYALDDVYDRVVAFMLESGMWNFAQRTVAIDPSTTTIPAFGFRNAFEVPSDFVRLISISANERLWPPLVANQWAYEGNHWQADCSTLYVSYVSNGVTYGMDLGSWPESFTRAVELELAVRIAPQLTNISAVSFEALQGDARRALRNARSKDAINQAGMEQPPGKMTMSRRNWRNNTLWYR